MNVFEAARAVSVREAAERYGLEVSRSGMVCCPFHGERHASMKVDRRYYCFACGATGDAIDFTAKLFGLRPYEAAKKLEADFRLEGTRPQPARIPDARQAEKRTMNALGRYLQLLRRFDRDYAPAHPGEPMREEFVESLQMKPKIEFLLDVLTGGDGQTRTETVQRLAPYLSQLEARTVERMEN